MGEKDDSLMTNINDKSNWENPDVTWGSLEDEKEEFSKNVAKSNSENYSNESRRKTECYEISTSTKYRRGYSEAHLLECMYGKTMSKGNSYHFVTGGDVDSLSFLKLVLVQEKRLDYLLCSTWVMAAEDILQFRQWIEDGVLGRVDFYLGETFKRTYRIEFGMLTRLVEETKCGRFETFRNHSKIYVGWNGDFKFAIETSANVNTNPRTEQGVITIDDGLCDFYKDFFDKI